RCPSLNFLPRHPCSLTADLKVHDLRGDSVFVVPQVVFNDDLHGVVASSNLFQLHMTRNDKLLAILWPLGLYRLTAACPHQLAVSKETDLRLQLGSLVDIEAGVEDL